MTVPKLTEVRDSREASGSAGRFTGDTERKESAMRVVRDDLWFCQDCLFAAVNGDFSGLDGIYSKEASERRYQEIVAGLEKLRERRDAPQWHLVPDFDSEAGKGIEDFSRRTCDCCGTRLAGDRYRFAVLGE